MLAETPFPTHGKPRELNWRACWEFSLQQMSLCLATRCDTCFIGLPFAITWHHRQILAECSVLPPNKQWPTQLLQNSANKNVNMSRRLASICEIYGPMLPGSWDWVLYNNLFNTYASRTAELYPDGNSLAGQPLVQPDFTVSWMLDKNGQRRSWKYTRVTRVPIAWDQRRTVWDFQNNRYATDKVYQLIHYGGWNILFTDGHVKYFTEKNRSPPTCPSSGPRRAELRPEQSTCKGGEGTGSH